MTPRTTRPVTPNWRDRSGHEPTNVLVHRSSRTNQRPRTMERVSDGMVPSSEDVPRTMFRGGLNFQFQGEYKKGVLMEFLPTCLLRQKLTHTHTHIYIYIYMRMSHNTTSSLCWNLQLDALPQPEVMQKTGTSDCEHPQSLHPHERRNMESAWRSFLEGV